MNLNISIIIPVLDFPETLPKVINQINKQTLPPKEIIIISSGNHDNMKKYIEIYTGSVPITIRYEERLFPGKARNIGVKLSNGKWVAFIDSKTMPKQNWLEVYMSIILKSKSDVVLGITRFIPKTNYQKLYNYCTYGNLNHQTVPGSLIKKINFIKKLQFSDRYKVGEDRLWKKELNNSSLIHLSPKSYFITYIGLPLTYIETIKKYFYSSLNTYYSPASNSDIKLSIILVIYSTILPKWNYIIGGWDENIFFIPHITKIVTATIILLYFLRIIFTKYDKIKEKTIFSYLLSYVTIISTIFIALNWNDTFTSWNKDDPLFIPHISKIYIIFLFFSLLIYRGIKIPIYKNIHYSHLFPFKWIIVGMIGLSLDIVKLIGYLFRVIFRNREEFEK